MIRVMILDRQYFTGYHWECQECGCMGRKPVPSICPNCGLPAKEKNTA